jgi:hypothetical protein
VLDVGSRLALCFLGRWRGQFHWHGHSGDDDDEVVVQDPVAQLLGHDGRDEHDDLVVGALPFGIDERHHRLNDRGVLGVKHPERHARVPAPPVLLERRERARARAVALETEFTGTMTRHAPASASTTRPGPD